MLRRFATPSSSPASPTSRPRCSSRPASKSLTRTAGLSPSPHHRTWGHSRTRACVWTPKWHRSRPSSSSGLRAPPDRERCLRSPFRDPYTSREATLNQIRSAIVGAGLLALVAAVVFGVVAARRVTAPIHRLRGVAARVAQGQLDERATASGVLEVDELAAQFNVMADRLSGTLRMLEADRDRLREFVADVSHELRTPIAALRMYTELQRDGQIDEVTRRGVPGALDRADRPPRMAEHQPARPVSDRRRHLPARHARRRPARPDPGRGAGALRGGAGARHRPRERGARGAGRPALRPRADRPAADQPDRERPQVHATRRRRIGPSRTRRGAGDDRGPRHRRRHPGRTSCRACSSASTAAPTPARREPREAGLGWQSCARSWRCTAARSTSPAWSARAPWSGSRSLARRRR